VVALRLMQGYAYRFRATAVEPLDLRSDSVAVDAGTGEATVTVRFRGARGPR
jgi:precorrin-6B methylase 2